MATSRGSIAAQVRTYQRILRRRERTRGNGEGSIYQRESDGRWCCSLTLENGKRKVLYGRTREEMAKKLRKELNDRDEGTVTTGGMTLARFVPAYLTAVELRNVRPRTLEAYREKLDRHILPTVGKVRLDKLTAADVQRLYATLRTEGKERKRADGTITKEHCRRARSAWSTRSCTRS
jgi:hypothetical protein